MQEEGCTPCWRSNKWVNRRAQEMKLSQIKGIPDFQGGSEIMLITVNGQIVSKIRKVNLLQRKRYYPEHLEGLKDWREKLKMPHWEWVISDTLEHASTERQDSWTATTAHQLNRQKIFIQFKLNVKHSKYGFSFGCPVKLFRNISRYTVYFKGCQ